MFADTIDSTNTDTERPAFRGLRYRQIPLPLQVVAYGLISFGTAILGTVLSLLYSTFQDLPANKFIATVARDLSAQPWVLSADKSFTIQLSSAATELIALLLFLIFALLGGWIGSTIVRCGVNIVSPQFNYQMARLKQRVSEVAAEMRGAIRPK
jgi:hypothetical protein